MLTRAVRVSRQLPWAASGLLPLTDLGCDYYEGKQRFVCLYNKHRNRQWIQSISSQHAIKRDAF